MSKPSLQEIAAMPLTAAQAAVRKYYDPNWGTDKPAAPVEWTVEVRYHHGGYATETFTVKANDAVEAEQKAIDMFNKGVVDLRGSECDIERVEVSA